ncbi:MAG: hypothetical protein K9L74_02505 [Candidatus Izimaplasma sp.]|nr:hypothetical protein [Candidatus Izimaplasma bacterium]
MKKSFIFIISVLFFSAISMLNFTVISATSSKTYINNNIKTENEIVEMAMNNSEKLQNNEHYQKIVIKQDGKVLPDNANAKAFQYTQRIKSETDSEGITTTTYSTISVFMVDPGGGGGGGSSLPDYDSAQYRSDWDGSIGVKAVSTIYWTETNSANWYEDYIELVMVDGEWTVYDPQLWISSKNVEVRAMGNYYINSYLIHYNKTVDFYPTSGSFQYYSPTHFDFYGALTSLSYGFGVNMKCTVNRGGFSWSFEFFNSYSNNIWG